jgi:DNA-binding NarL/FixJ family response regulator
MARFLLVDDHAMIREGLQRTLSAEFPGSEFVAAATPTEALGAIERQSVDVVILDLGLPGRGGIDLLHEIKDRSPRSRVLVHTMHPEDQFGIRALRAGADGYVTKESSVAELLAAVRRVRGGGRYISAALAERLVEAVAKGDQGHLMEALSDREHQILKMITAGKTPSEIAAELCLSIKTVSTYRARLLEKLHAHSTAELIRIGLEHKLG